MEEAKARRCQPGLLRRLLDAWEDRLFAPDDSRARARGWTVSRPAVGRGRVYRDPRWDLVSQCPRCAGAGNDPISVGPCAVCAGAGTVRSDVSEPSVERS